MDAVERLSCQAILFDLDGVLVDSTACIESTWQHWAAEHGIDVDAILNTAHGRKAVEVIRLVAPDVDADHEAMLLAERESSALSALSVRVASRLTGSQLDVTVLRATTLANHSSTT